MSQENGLYEYRKKQAVVALAKIDPTKPLGTELFNSVARVSVTVTPEAVCLREDHETETIEVLLVQRSPDDTAYPGEWNCPGSALRPGEEFAHVFNRLAQKEFCAELHTVAFVGNFNDLKEARGHFLSMVYLCRVVDGGRGTWFKVDSLPSNTVHHHRDAIIPMAVAEFLRRKRSSLVL